jgi:hypothetical protein
VSLPSFLSQLFNYLVVVAYWSLVHSSILVAQLPCHGESSGLLSNVFLHRLLTILLWYYWATYCFQFLRSFLSCSTVLWRQSCHLLSSVSSFFPWLFNCLVVEMLENLLFSDPSLLLGLQLSYCGNPRLLSSVPPFLP